MISLAVQSLVRKHPSGYIRLVRDPECKLSHGAFTWQEAADSKCAGLGLFVSLHHALKSLFKYGFKIFRAGPA